MISVRCLGLVVALASSACVVGQGQGKDGLPSGPSPRTPGMTGAAGTETPMGAGAPGASGGAVGRTAAGANAAGANGADRDSGARAGSTGGGTGGRAGERDAASAHDSAMDDDSGQACTPLNVQVCNPVTNEGCPDALMMQCAVDPLATLTGYCIFYSGQQPTPGLDCFNSGVTESCPPTFTCLDGRCRELCFCDDDCGGGQCCVESLEGTGFKACREC